MGGFARLSVSFLLLTVLGNCDGNSSSSGTRFDESVCPFVVDASQVQETTMRCGILYTPETHASPLLQIQVPVSSSRAGTRPYRLWSTSAGVPGNRGQTSGSTLSPPATPMGSQWWSKDNLGLDCPSLTARRCVSRSGWLCDRGSRTGSRAVISNDGWPT
jgi:hypothetical protein